MKEIQWPEDITIKVLRGQEMIPYLEIAAQWRIQEFKRFPYLYEGNLEYESMYMHECEENPEAVLIVGERKGEILGFTTGIPIGTMSDLLKSLRTKLPNAHEYYYLAECIFAPTVRGRGFAQKGIKLFEEVVNDLGYKKICFLTVIRDKNHPLRPARYLDKDPIWQRWKYQKTELVLEFPWPTIQEDGSVIDFLNPMRFWEKDISVAAGSLPKPLASAA